MPNNTQSYKGTRDFYPEDKRLQKWIFSNIRESVERYGYEEYDAPVIESTEIYQLKGSSEIINEQSYTFIDRGGRSVTLRTEMTPSVSRMVANRRQHLAYPLRWYSIPNLWRYERPQRGRLREFWQLNIDLFGVDNLAGEIEVIQVADSILQDFKAKRSMYEIRLNSRKFMDYVLLEYLKLDNVSADTVRRLIDKKSKMSANEFSANIESVIPIELREKNTHKILEKILSAKKSSDFPENLQNLESLVNIFELIDRLVDIGISNVLFDPTLVRGFDYYTDVVFEIFDTNPNNNRAMYGGGRYDGLVGLFGVEKVPTVGFGMGDVTLENFLRDNNLIPDINTETELYIALMPGIKYSEISKQLYMLREEGVKVAVDLTHKKVPKQLDTAIKKNIKYAFVIGERELETNQFVLKDLKKGSDSEHSLERIISIVKSQT